MNSAKPNTLNLTFPAYRTCLQTVLKVYEKHAKASEAMINEKTEIFGIGERDDPKEKKNQEKLDSYSHKWL